VEDTPCPDTRVCLEEVDVECLVVEDAVDVVLREDSLVLNSTNRHVMLELVCHPHPCPSSHLLLSKHLLPELPPLLMSL